MQFVIHGDVGEKKINLPFSSDVREIYGPLEALILPGRRPEWSESHHLLGRNVIYSRAFSRVLSTNLQGGLWATVCWGGFMDAILCYYAELVIFPHSFVALKCDTL